VTHCESLVSVEANLLRQVKGSKRIAAPGRSQNEARTRQALRGIREMFRKDGLL
jgi:hypothetical protein